MSKTLLIADTHLKPYNENNHNLSLWEKEAQRFALDKIISINKKNKVNKTIHLGDLLETHFPKDFELELVDYFFNNIPKGVEFTIISGNHELNRDSTKRTYYWDFMKEYYKPQAYLKARDFNKKV